MNKLLMITLFGLSLLTSLNISAAAYTSRVARDNNTGTNDSTSTNKTNIISITHVMIFKGFSY